MPRDPQTVFYALVGLVFVIVVFAFAWCSPSGTTIAFVAVLALQIDTRTPVTMAVTAGSLTIYLLDVVVAAMLGVGLLRLLSRETRVEASSALIGVLLIASMNVYRGQRSFGFQPAFAESRPWVYLAAAVLYTATVPARPARWWARVLGVYVAVLLCVAVVGFRRTGLRSVTDQIVVAGTVLDPRPITSSGALVVAEVVVLVVAACLHGRRRLVPVAVGLLLVIALFQQRTVWLALTVGLTVLGAAALSRGGRTRLASLLALLVTALVAGLLALTSVFRTSTVEVSAQNALSSDSTFTWRLDGWRALLSQGTTLWDTMLGKPFGAGYSREIRGAVVTVAPHSHYVEAFLRFGLVGIVLLGWLVVACWRGAASNARRLGTTPIGLRAVLVLLLVFGVSYRWDPIQGIVLGTLVAVSLPRTTGAGRPVPVAPAGRGERVAVGAPR